MQHADARTGTSANTTINKTAGITTNHRQIKGHFVHMVDVILTRTARIEDDKYRVIWRVYAVSNMGKSKNKRFRSKKARPTGLQSVKEIEDEEEELGTSNPTATEAVQLKAVGVLEKV